MHMIRNQPFMFKVGMSRSEECLLIWNNWKYVNIFISWATVVSKSIGYSKINLFTVIWEPSALYSAMHKLCFSQAPGSPQMDMGSEMRVAEVTEQLTQMEELVAHLKELIREKDAALSSKDDQAKVFYRLQICSIWSMMLFFFFLFTFSLLKMH